jgi:hypothetical protein
MSLILFGRRSEQDNHKFKFPRHLACLIKAMIDLAVAAIVLDKMGLRDA